MKLLLNSWKIRMRRKWNWFWFSYRTKKRLSGRLSNLA